MAGREFRRGLGARGWMAGGAAVAALAVVCGAFGAHIIQPQLETWFDDAPRRMDLWKTAASYQMYSALGMMWIGSALSERTRWMHLSGCGLLLGAVLFSGSLYGLAVSHYRVLGMIAPVGGTAMILGWVAAAWGVCPWSSGRQRRDGAAHD